MKLLASPFLAMIWRTRTLRHAAIICVALALVSSVSEIAVALSLVPILASLGVEAGSELANFVNRIPPAGWLMLFAIAVGLRSAVNWLSSIQEERGTQELVVSLQSRLYRALAAAHWDAVRRLAPPTITSALQTQTYEASYGFSYMIRVITAAFLVIGYLASTAAVFPIMLPGLLFVLAMMWRFNARRSDRVRVQSESYVDAQTELHQRYEDWVAISRISSLGMDARNLADRFESDAREAAAHAVDYSRSSAATHASYDMAVVAGICVGIPVAWWLETPPALLAFGLVAFVRVLPRASGIQTGYQGVINAVAPLRAVEQLAVTLERDPAAAVEAKWRQWLRRICSDLASPAGYRTGGDQTGFRA